MSEPRRSWVVAGGGTGGHVTPALALAERIRERGDSVHVLGSQRGLETRLVPEAGFELVALPARQIAGQGLLSRLRALPDMLRGCVAARRSLRDLHTDIVVSVGGYASVPAVVAAALGRVPLALLEPNAIPGRANRAAARFADLIFVQFEEAASVLARPGRADRVRVPGIPLRRALIGAFAGRAPRRLAEAPLRVLVFGGSQGARQINDAMIEVAGRLDAATLEVFHQTGEADRERVAAAYAEAGVRAEVVAFETDMPSRYLWADVAVCRSGALTVAELALAGLPGLLVPYPYAADDHQAANAHAMTAAGAARTLRGEPAELAPAIAEALDSFVRSPHELRGMAEAAAKLARPDAAERIVDACLEMLTARAGR